MLFTQNYATSTAMVAVAALATMVMSVVDVATGARLGVVVGASVATMLVGNVVGARRRGEPWDPAHWDDDAA